MEYLFIFSQESILSKTVSIWVHVCVINSSDIFKKKKTTFQKRISKCRSYNCFWNTSGFIALNKLMDVGSPKLGEGRTLRRGCEGRT